MSYEFYKTIHFLSIFSLIASLILALVCYRTKTYLRPIMIIHGLSWIIVFASSFGLVSALGLHENFPVWGKIKTVLWVLLGIIPFLIKRKPELGRLNLVLISLIASFAIYLAVYKPF